jgi:hypothetical protein
MERNVALIGFGQLDTKQHFFDTTSAQGDLGWSSGQAMGVYKLCRCNFKGKTRKGLKKNTSSSMIFFEVSLAKLKVVWRGPFMSRTDNTFFWKEG